MDTTETKPSCEWCNKSFYNIYALKRHYERCKLKEEYTSKQTDKQLRDLHSKLKEYECKYKEIEHTLAEETVKNSNLNSQLGEKEKQYNQLSQKYDSEKEKYSELFVKYKQLETKNECTILAVERYEKQLSVLLEKMSTSTYNNVVAGFGGHEIKVVHTDVLPKCQSLISDIDQTIKHLK